MNDESTVVDVPEAVHTELVKVGDRAGLNQGEAIAVREQFAGYYARVQEALVSVPAGLTGENPGHVRIARATRLSLREIRCDIETARKTMKEGIVRRGKAIDGWANVLKDMIATPEEAMQEVEQYAERKEAARVAEMVADRTTALVAAEADPTIYNLAAMDEATFQGTLEGAKQKQTERKEAAAKAEADRLAKEQAEARVKAENARLKDEAKTREKAMKAEREAAAKKQREIEERARKEREINEAKAKKEREAADAALKKEREARERAQAEAAEARAKEEQRIRAEQEASEKAAQAPDKEKLIALAATIDEMSFPAMKTKRGKDTLRKAEMMLSEVADFLKEQAEVM